MEDLEARTLRILVAALASSDLSGSDLARAATLLERPQFRKSLGAAVRYLSNTSGNEQKGRGSPGKKGANEDDVDELFDYVQRKKLSKAQTWEIMTSIDLNLPASASDMSLREMVVAYLEGGGSNRLAKFVNQATTKAKSDPYLQGILDRRS